MPPNRTPTLDQIAEFSRQLDKGKVDKGTIGYQFSGGDKMSTATSAASGLINYLPRYTKNTLLKATGVMSEDEYQEAMDHAWVTHTEHLPEGLRLLGEGWQDVAESASETVTDMPWYLKYNPAAGLLTGSVDAMAAAFGEEGAKEAVHQVVRRTPEIFSAAMGAPGLMDTGQLVPYKQPKTWGGSAGAMAAESAEYFAALASINKATAFGSAAQGSSRLVQTSMNVANLAKSSLVAASISEAQQTRLNAGRFTKNAGVYFAIIGGSQLFRGVVAPGLKSLARGGKLSQFLNNKTLEGSVAKTLQGGSRLADYLIVRRADDWIESVSETAYWATTQRPKGETFMGAFMKALPSALVVNYFQESIGDLPLLNSGGPMSLFSREHSNVDPEAAMAQQQWVEQLRDNSEKVRIALDNGMRASDSEMKAFEQYERLGKSEKAMKQMLGRAESSFEDMYEEWREMGLNNLMHRADLKTLDTYRTARELKEQVNEIDNQLFAGEMSPQEAREAYEDAGIQPATYDKFADMWMVNTEPLFPAQASDPRHGRQPLVPNEAQVGRKQGWENSIRAIANQMRSGETEAGMDMVEEAIDRIDEDAENGELTPVQARSLKRRVNTLAGVEAEVEAEPEAEAEAGKYPWQMTVDEKLRSEAFGFGKDDIQAAEDYIGDEAMDAFRKGYKNEVRQALEDGKPVPEKVLQEYPDLQEQYGEQAEMEEAQPEATMADVPEMEYQDFADAPEGVQRSVMEQYYAAQGNTEMETRMATGGEIETADRPEAFRWFKNNAPEQTPTSERETRRSELDELSWTELREVGKEMDVKLTPGKTREDITDEILNAEADYAPELVSQGDAAYRKWGTDGIASVLMNSSEQELDDFMAWMANQDHPLSDEVGQQDAQRLFAQFMMGRVLHSVEGASPGAELARRHEEGLMGEITDMVDALGEGDELNPNEVKQLAGKYTQKEVEEAYAAASAHSNEQVKQTAQTLAELMKERGHYSDDADEVRRPDPPPEATIDSVPWTIEDKREQYDHAEGNETDAVWPGDPIETRYEVWEADAIETSHNRQGHENPKYPQTGLQNRIEFDAERPQDIASRDGDEPFNPAMLGQGASSQNGAPVVTEELLVGSGNARVLAIQLVADSNDDVYREWLVGNAEQFGIDPGNVESMERPVLVRRMVDNPDLDTLQKWAEWNNTPDVYELSGTEKAVQDASHIDQDMLSRLSVLANGKLSTSLSNSFTKAWVREVLSGKEKGDLITKDKTHLTPEGQRRMTTSVLARVYLNWEGDKSVREARLRMLKRLAQQADATANLKNFQLGMLRAADDVARARVEVDDGVLGDEYDIGDTMIQVLELVRRARDTYDKSPHKNTWTLRTALETELQDPSLFGESRELGTDFTPGSKKLARILVGDPVMPNKDVTTMGRSEEDARKPIMRSSRKIGRLLSQVARRVTSQDRGGRLGFETAEDLPPMETVIEQATDDILRNKVKQGDVLGFPGGEELQLEAGEDQQEEQVSPEEPTVDRQQVVNALRAALGVKIGTGGYQATVWNTTRKGIYKNFQRVIRMQQAHDLQTVTHEVGHDLAGWFNLFDQIVPEARGELMRLGKELYPSYEGDDAVNEGFAEFSRLWFTDPGAAQNEAPNMYEQWDSLIEQADLGDPLGDIQDMVQEYINQGSMARIRSVWMPEAEGKERALEMEGEMYYDELTRVIRDLENILFDPHAYIKEFESQMGPAEEISQSPKELAKALSGTQGAALSMLLSSDTGGRGQRDYETWDVVGPTYGDVIEPIANAERLDEFKDYMLARHRITGGQKETGMTLEDAQNTVKRLESENGEVFRKAHENLVKWRKRNAQYLEDSGLLPEGIVEKWAKEYPDYVPLMRIFDYIQQIEKSGSGGLVPIKRRKGSTRPIRDPIESDLRMAYATIYAAEMNRFKKALVGMAETSEGGGKWFEKIPADQIPTNVSMDEAVKALKEAGADVENVDRELLSEAFQVWRPSWFAPADTITVYREGQKQFFEVKDKRLLKSVGHLTSNEVGIMKKMLTYAGKPAKMFKKGVTLNPLFWGKRNPVRDLFTGFIQHDYGLTYASHVFEGFAEAIGKGEKYGEWLSSGAAMSQLVNIRHIDDPNIQVAELVGKDKWKNLVKGDPIPVIPALEELAAVGENAGRMASYLAASDYLEQASEKGTLEGSQQFKKPINRILAAGRQSQESNVNFSNIGLATRYANVIKPFFSANMNGMQTLMRNATGGANVTGGMGEVAPARGRKAWQFWSKAVGSITMFSLMVYLLNRMIPAYQEISDREKDIYWHIPLGISENENQMWFKIPKPFEQGILFGSLPERFLRYVDQDDPTAFDGFFQSMTSTWPGTDLLDVYKGGFYPFQPMSEAHFNESFFWDSPIFPTNLEKKAGFLQSRPSTTEITKTLSRQMERMTGSSFSPAKAEHLLRGYFGSLGIMGLRTLDWSLQGLGVVKEEEGGMSGMTEWPMVRPQLRRAGQYAKSVDDFYTEYNESRKAYTSWRQMQSNNNFKGAQDYYQRHEDQITRYGQMQSVGKMLSQLREQRNQIYKRDIPSDQKRKAINDLNLRMVNQARRVLNREPLD